MKREEFKASRTRNWLALLLMAIAAFAAGHSQAMAPVPAGLHASR